MSERWRQVEPDWWKKMWPKIPAGLPRFWESSKIRDDIYKTQENTPEKTGRCLVGASII
jgi:hypothetical protein